ncbi:MAG: hypothetical protein L6422_12965 [Candidatus Marinimicrobia bacterium]|nr:hypothetical protein [bacterium]MCG2717156.1 hypothetical protein [Candidatus Neomarinimicrobiota bacterium]
MNRFNLPHQYYIEYFFLFWLNRLLPRLTHPQRFRFATILGWLIYRFLPFRKNVVLTNLKKAFPERSNHWHKDIARKTYLHIARVYFDLFALFQVSNDRFEQMVKSVNSKVVDDALKENRGVIVILFHFGNWELAADWFARKGYKVAAVAARLKNPLAHRLIFETRMNNGLQLFKKGKRENIKIIKYLKKDHILYMITDQDARKNGIWIKYFNQWSSSFRGPALFARRQQSPMILCTCLMDNNGKYNIHFERFSMEVPKEDEEESPVHYLTQSYTNYFENLIRQYPEQYYWLHRRWKTKVPKHIAENGR